jgi:hypothetical protein
MAISFRRPRGAPAAPAAPAAPPPSPVRYYANTSGISNVRRYRIGPDWIEVTFQSKGVSTYLYTYASAGQAQVETMKRLAVAGWGLNRYIGRVVRTGYDSKW